MDNVIDIAVWKSEREQRNISPLLQKVEEMRRVARLLMLNAEIMEAQAYGFADVNYDEMAEEKNKNLRILHNA